jgi:hypothetical protein
MSKGVVKSFTRDTLPVFIKSPHTSAVLDTSTACVWVCVGVSSCQTVFEYRECGKERCVWFVITSAENVSVTVLAAADTSSPCSCHYSAHTRVSMC